MATINPARKFAEHTMKVERVLSEFGVAGNAGRVVFVLTMANRECGVTHGEIIDALGLRKDVLSKFVRSLVDAGVLTQERRATNARIKRLATTDSGRALLSRVKATLEAPRPAKPEPDQADKHLSFFD